jgi:hypothetical protein
MREWKNICSCNGETTTVYYTGRFFLFMQSQKAVNDPLNIFMHSRP